MADQIDPALLAAFTAAVGAGGIPRAPIVPPVVPIMGGLLPPDYKGISVPYTGGTPNADWTGLVGVTTHSPNCNRPKDSEGATKNWNLRIAPPTHLLKKNDPDFGIVRLAYQVGTHARQYGMDSIMYIPSRADPTGPSVNLITAFEQVTIEHVITQSVNYRENLWDEYDLDNDAAMQIYLRECLDSSLMSVLALYIRPEDTAAVIWMRIVKSIHDTSVNRYRQLKSDLTTLTPLNEPGQNVKEYTIKVRKIFEELTSARQFTWDLMVPVLRALEQVSVTKFTGFIPILEERVNQGISDIAYLSTDDAVLEMRKRGAHWDTILEQMETRYEALVSSKSWDPANLTLDRNGTQIQANALIQGTSRMLCTYCGSNDHWANKCPDKSVGDKGNAAPSSDNSTVTNVSTNTVSWKNIAPLPGSPGVQVRNERTFYWCQKCFRGVGRWNASHKTSEHKANLPRQPAASVAEANPAPGIPTSFESNLAATSQVAPMRFVFS